MAHEVARQRRSLYEGLDHTAERGGRDVLKATPEPQPAALTPGRPPTGSGPAARLRLPTPAAREVGVRAHAARSGCARFTSAGPRGGKAWDKDCKRGAQWVAMRGSPVATRQRRLERDARRREFTAFPRQGPHAPNSLSNAHGWQSCSDRHPARGFARARGRARRRGEARAPLLPAAVPRYRRRASSAPLRIFVWIRAMVRRTGRR